MGRDKGETRGRDRTGARSAGVHGAVSCNIERARPCARGVCEEDAAAGVGGTACEIARREGVCTPPGEWPLWVWARYVVSGEFTQGMGTQAPREL